MPSLRKAGTLWAVVVDGGRGQKVMGRDIMGNKRREIERRKAMEAFEGRDKLGLDNWSQWIQAVACSIDSAKQLSHRTK